MNADSWLDSVTLSGPATRLIRARKSQLAGQARVGFLARLLLTPGFWELLIAILPGLIQLLIQILAVKARELNLSPVDLAMDLNQVYRQVPPDVLEVTKENK